MEISKKLSNEQQCDIHVVSSSNNYLIKQISEKEFIILKKYKQTKTKGCLWWKKSTSEEKYNRIDRYGKKLFCNTYPIFDTNFSDLITYKTLEDAKKWIENYKKYPIDYYC
jgi:hypothetical protein